MRVEGARTHLPFFALVVGAVEVFKLEPAIWVVDTLSHVFNLT